MADEDISTGESGSETGGSTAPADAGSDQISDQAPADKAPAAAEGAKAPPAPEKSEDEMSLQEIADKQAADEAKAEEDESAKDDKPEDKVEEKKPEETTEQNEPKSLKEARGHIKSLETQITPLREMEKTVLEIGGMPVLETARPLIDTVMNPEATASEIFEALAEAAPHHDAQSLAWQLLENDDNQAAAIQHFFGEDVTPEIVEQLVTQFKEGKIDLDKADSDEDADDVFLTDREKTARAREKAAEAKDAEATKSAKAAKALGLGAERTASYTKVASVLETSVSDAIKDFAVDEANDTPEMKSTKGFINTAINAMIAFELSTDPTFQRVQKLIAKNGTKAAEALTQGALARKISDRAAQLAKDAQPLFTGAVGKIQKQAKTIKDVREEPDGALGQGDATRKKEIDYKKPGWRQDLDAEFEGKIRDLKTKTARERGQSA